MNTTIESRQTPLKINIEDWYCLGEAKHELRLYGGSFTNNSLKLIERPGKNKGMIEKALGYYDSIGYNE